MLSNINTIIDKYNRRGKQIELFSVTGGASDVSYLSSSYDKVRYYPLNSITKSITSTIALMVANDSGVSTMTPILYWLDQPRVQAAYSDLTVDDCLNMQANIAWREFDNFNDPNNDFRNFIQSEQPLAYLFSRPSSQHHFTYNTALTHAIVYWAEAVMGVRFESLAERWLFKPLGINNYQWTRDANGAVYGGHGLKMRGEDFLRLADLFANNLLLPKAVIQQLRQPVIDDVRRSHTINYGYGYGFWYGTIGGEFYKGAFGAKGKRLYYFDNGLVFSFLGYTEPEFGIQEKIILKYLKQR